MSARPQLSTAGRRAGRWLARTAALGAIAASAIACGHRPSTSSGSLTSAQQSRPVDYWSALQNARAARERALALRAPSAPDLDGVADDGVTTALAKWAAARRDASQDAQRAYDEALAAAPEPKDAAVVHAELADLWLGVLEDTRGALFAAAPAAYRSAPAFSAPIGSAASYALRGLVDRIAAHVDDCARLSDVRAANGTCAKVAARFADATDPNRLDGSRGAPSAVATAPRPVVPTTRPKPCTFQGTLVTRGAVYDRESGGAVVLAVDPGTPIEVDALEIPSRAGARYKVTVRWPTATTGYLEAGEPPLAFMRRVELVPGAVWAPPGTRIDASDARGPTVRATRAFGDAAGAAALKSSASAFDRRLFCHDLELATAPPAPPVLSRQAASAAANLPAANAGARF